MKEEEERGAGLSLSQVSLMCLPFFNYSAMQMGTCYAVCKSRTITHSQRDTQGSVLPFTSPLPSLPVKGGDRALHPRSHPLNLFPSLSFSLPLSVMRPSNGFFTLCDDNGPDLQKFHTPHPVHGTNTKKTYMNQQHSGRWLMAMSGGEKLCK